MENQLPPPLFPQTPTHLFTEEQREQRLQAAKRERPPGPLWVFAFGSLMWNPCFDYDRCDVAVFEGWERKFHIWTTIARGTPEQPGLGLCIEPGETCCKGLAYRLLPENEEDDWQKLWSREMVSGIYQAKWADMTLQTGEAIRALTFVVDKSHRQYAGGMSLAEMSEIIARASGKYGPCREYLRSTVEEMAKIGEVDPYLNDLLAAVNARVGQAPGSV